MTSTTINQPVTTEGRVMAISFEAIAKARASLDAEMQRLYDQRLDSEQVDALHHDHIVFGMLDDMESRMGLNVTEARALLAETHCNATPATGPLQAACPTCGGTRILRLIRTTVGTEIANFVRMPDGEIVPGALAVNELVDYDNAGSAEHQYKCIGCGLSMNAEDLCHRDSELER